MAHDDTALRFEPEKPSFAGQIGFNGREPGAELEDVTRFGVDRLDELQIVEAEPGDSRGGGARNQDTVVEIVSTMVAAWSLYDASLDEDGAALELALEIALPGIFIGSPDAEVEDILAGDREEVDVDGGFSGGLDDFGGAGDFASKGLNSAIGFGEDLVGLIELAGLEGLDADGPSEEGQARVVSSGLPVDGPEHGTEDEETHRGEDKAGLVALEPGACVPPFLDEDEGIGLAGSRG